MIILFVVAISLALAWARGGRFSNLGLLQIRWRGVIMTGFMIQVLIFSRFWQGMLETRSLTPLFHLVSLVVLLVALTANLRLPGMWLIMLGFGCNFLVIAANGGYMPNLGIAQALTGRSPLEAGQVYANSIGMGPETRLVWLADIFAIPSDFVFPNVFSIGDVLITLGAFYLIQKAMVEPTSFLYPSSAPRS